MDVKSEIRQAIDTGKVIFGPERTLKSIKSSQSKMVIISANCMESVRADIERYAKLANIPVYKYPSDNIELGLVCGKPFLVSAVAILDPGSSSILSLGGSK